MEINEISNLQYEPTTYYQKETYQNKATSSQSIEEESFVYTVTQSMVNIIA